MLGDGITRDLLLMSGIGGALALAFAAYTVIALVGARRTSDVIERNEFRQESRFGVIICACAVMYTVGMLVYMRHSPVFVPGLAARTTVTLLTLAAALTLVGFVWRNPWPGFARRR
jgi:protein-S-isoprenylcysteine O-methyltransferase Ste14